MKTLALLAALLISTTMACAQTTVKDVLGTMPPEVIPYINSDQRGEMNKFTIDNDTVVVKNTLNGTSTVTTIGDDFARLDLNKNTRLIIKLLPVSDSTQIICLVKSVRKPVPESVVEFYDTNWKAINNNFNLPDTRNAEAMLNEQDRQFLENLHALLDRHLDDEDFGIASLAKEMNMSYSSLYARIKSLTGQTPQNFLITYRMNTAMQLLQTGKYTVSEVCYKVGASSLANFSRSFKRQFGVPPSEV